MSLHDLPHELLCVVASKIEIRQWMFSIGRFHYQNALGRFALTNAMSSSAARHAILQDSYWQTQLACATPTDAGFLQALGQIATAVTIRMDPVEAVPISHALWRA
eukprot:464324-Prymnesium_polylepis.1